MKDIEISGSGGYAVYRIPAITVSAKGTVITACECRISRDDWDTRAIGLRISRDGGKVFSERIVADGDDTLAVNNPVLCSLPDGRIILLYQKNYERTFVRISDNDGESFGEAFEITPCFEGFSSRHPFNVCAVGPGHGTVMPNGRIIVPVWITYNPQRYHWPSVCGTIYSDDRGETWHAGIIAEADDEFVSPSETTAAALEDGSVLLNIRHAGDVCRRALCVSSDGQSDCSRRIFCEDLADPCCCASMINTSDRKRLYYCGCDSTDSRTNLTLKYSDDAGKHWNVLKRIYPSAGYSDIAFTPDEKHICCYFERDDLSALSFEIIGVDDAE